MYTEYKERPCKIGKDGRTRGKTMMEKLVEEHDTAETLKDSLKVGRNILCQEFTYRLGYKVYTDYKKRPCKIGKDL